MEQEWFYDIVDSWGLGLGSDDPRRDQLSAKVYRLAELNGGNVYADTPMSDSEQRDHAVLRAEEALQHRAGYYGILLRRHHVNPDFYWAKDTGSTPQFGYLAALKARTDVNSASLDSLIALPKIGPITAQRFMGIHF